MVRTPVPTTHPCRPWLEVTFRPSALGFHRRKVGRDRATVSDTRPLDSRDPSRCRLVCRFTSSRSDSRLYSVLEYRLAVNSLTQTCAVPSLRRPWQATPYTLVSLWQCAKVGCEQLFTPHAVGQSAKTGGQEAAYITRMGYVWATLVPRYGTGTLQ